MNAFFNSQFSYCPFICVCQRSTINKKINRLHETCLRLIYSDKQSSFEELLEKRWFCFYSRKKYPNISYRNV